MAAGKLILIKRKQGVATRALSLAKRNQKRLGRVSDLKSGFIADATSTLNATPIVKDGTLAVSSGGANPKGFACFMKVLRIRGIVRQNLTSALADDYRIDVILDRFPEETLTTPLEVYGSTTPSTIAQVLFGERKRFRILKSWKGLLEPQNNIGRLFGSDIKLNLKLETDTSDSFGFGNLTKNMIVIFMWTTATANQPSIKINYRIEIID